MPHITTEVSCPLQRSFRVEQIAGMFDVPLREKLTERFEVELPDADEAWDIDEELDFAICDFLMKRKLSK